MQTSRNHFLMLHRLAFISSLILTSALAFEQTALGQSVDVPFSGTVSGQATFSVPTSGTAQTNVSSSFSGVANNFESLSSATLSVQSSTPTTITVSPPRLVSGPTPDPTGTTRTAYLKFGSTNVSTEVGGGSAKLPAGNTNIQVDMLVKRPVAFTPGTYTYTVTLTMTP